MDVTTDPFTSEEICEQATGNAGALSLVLLAYARERGESLPEVARFAGRIFAPGWDTERGKGARGRKVGSTQRRLLRVDLAATNR